MTKHYQVAQTNRDNWIDYKRISETEVDVFLENKRIGTINQSEQGWQYTPKGCKTGGEFFASLREVKLSLEED